MRVVRLQKTICPAVALVCLPFTICQVYQTEEEPELVPQAGRLAIALLQPVMVHLSLLQSPGLQRHQVPTESMNSYRIYKIMLNQPSDRELPQGHRPVVHPGLRTK